MELPVAFVNVNIICVLTIIDLFFHAFCFQQCDLESGVDILVATPGYHVDFVEGWWFSFEGIKYLVMDGGDTEKRKIVDMKNRSKDSVSKTVLFTFPFPCM